jgi:tetratricopeptide (TPR) repeat protein
MAKSLARAAILWVLCGCGAIRGLAASSAAKPLRATELLALVAGSALPENIVREIVADGLAFRPNDSYHALLKTAGADPKILAAVDSAKVVVDQAPETESGKGLLQHIATAGSMIKDNRNDEAANELTAAVTASFQSPECGFVMAQVLRLEERWDEAAAIYQEVLREAPDFPEAHTKLSFIMYRLNDFETGLTEAHAALKLNPENAEAHKNAGLALMSMQKFEAALAEYHEALRLKPDYEAAHVNMGILYIAKSDWDNAIASFQKAVRLDADDAGAYYNLAYSFDQKGDFEAAIHAYREVKRIEPRRYDARQNLGADLMNHDRFAEAVVEFRELVKLYPDNPMCVYSLALGLFKMADLEGAAKEFRRAAELDPSNPMPHYNLGAILDEQKKYDEALKEYARALQMNDGLAFAHEGVGKILLSKNALPEAVGELQKAADLMPAEPTFHSLYGKALEASGRTDDAIREFQQAATLDPKNLQMKITLAAALEKKGDWAAAIAEYRTAALADASIDFRTKTGRTDDRDPQQEYADAQKRLADHVAALKAAGKASEAVALEARIAAANATPNLSEQLDAAMRDGLAAARERRYDEALRDIKRAVELGEKMQPHDQRLLTALDYLGKALTGQDLAAARAAFERELQVAQELTGPQSPAVAAALQSLASNALRQKDFAGAEHFYFQAVDITEKFFGEGSDKVASSLIYATTVYMVQQQYEKAEPYLLRAVRIDEALYGPDNIGMSIPLTALCSLYDHWDQPTKAAACDQHLLIVLEKQYGASSPVLVTLLTSESKALRGMGRSDEAEKLDQRVAQIRAATMTP